MHWADEYGTYHLYFNMHIIYELTYRGFGAMKWSEYTCIKIHIEIVTRLENNSGLKKGDSGLSLSLSQSTM